MHNCVLNISSITILPNWVLGVKGLSGAIIPDIRLLDCFF